MTLVKLSDTVYVNPNLICAVRATASENTVILYGAADALFTVEGAVAEVVAKLQGGAEASEKA